jgi:hypothetical protein
MTTTTASLTSIYTKWSIYSFVVSLTLSKLWLFLIDGMLEEWQIGALNDVID